MAQLHGHVSILLLKPLLIAGSSVLGVRHLECHCFIRSLINKVEVRHALAKWTFLTLVL